MRRRRRRLNLRTTQLWHLPSGRSGGRHVVVDHSLQRTVDSQEPITTREIKVYLGVQGTHDDDLIRDSVKAARQQVEKDTRRAFLLQTYVQKLDEFPTECFIELHRPPLSSVSSVIYRGTTSDAITFPSTSYEQDTNRTPGAIWLKEGESWPGTKDLQNSVTITYIAGYGSKEDVPAEAKQAIKVLAAEFYNMRCGIQGPPNRDNYLWLIQGLRWGDYR